MPGPPGACPPVRAPRRLPDFPWDRLGPYAEIAAAHPDGIVDLSVGTPVDSTPEVARRALTAASDAPGYPLTAGTATVRRAAARWISRRFGVSVADDAVLPVIGTKELVALLPGHLGLGAHSCVAFPGLAYPTYDVGARLAGARPVVADFPDDLADGGSASGADLLWINSPANPTGRVLSVEQLAALVAAGRRAGAIVVSDECYADFGWDAEPVSVLHPDVCGGSHAGLLAVHSMSKRSNLAGYRAGFITGDPALVAELREVRRHAGMIVPAPVQAALEAVLDDEEHVAVQRQRYADRRTVLRAGLEAAGFRVEHSSAGLYLWVTRDESCWDSVRDLAEQGILVAPGEFYGAAGGRHVRVALTAPDARVAAAAARLTGAERGR
ncbi:MAG: succinyldiaminopimelate transaminase [Actinomycetota bacterium]|nr:succinyldiaminopimelate transaminase [Actinomycetota bacterium]